MRIIAVVKLYKLILLVILTFLLTACGGGDSSSGGGESPNAGIYTGSTTRIISGKR
jgi:hypothetical protein